jgi:hypothetical protein
MLERILAVVAAVASPFLARYLLTSGRHRRRAEVLAYIELAKALGERKPDDAASVDELVQELTADLVATERRSLARRFDPWSLLVAPLFVLPVLIPLIFFWPVNEWWEWIFVALLALWTTIVSVAAWQSSWKPRDEDKKDHDGT